LAFDGSLIGQHITLGFMQVLLDVVSLNICSSVGCCSGWTFSIWLLFVNFYFFIFIQQRLWADVFQIQHLHKALPVMGYIK